MDYKPTFGGEWTVEKLDVLSKYLSAYTKIFRTNPHASFYRTVYVDAFAGAGYIRSPETAAQQGTPLFPELARQDAQEFIKGSAVCALEVKPPFDRYLFIDRDPQRCTELEKLKAKYPRRAIQVENADANRYLNQWCQQTNWKRTRSVVFLDPYGMQVEWALLQEIASTKAIDLWFIFPLGMGVMRLLTSKKLPPSEWAARLTRVLGTDAWKHQFYRKAGQQTLFGAPQEHERNATCKAVGSFFLLRLSTIFAGVAAQPYALMNSSNTPLYLLCFAAANPSKAAIAVRIAQDIMGGEHGYRL